MYKKILTIIILLFGSFFLSSCKSERINGIIKATSVLIETDDNVRSLTVGESLQLKHKVFPSTASQIVTWESNNEEIASVNSNGLVTAISSGKVKITAKTDSVSSQIYLTVFEKTIKVKEIAINGTKEVYVFDYIKLNYVLTPADANEEVVWTSENEQIAKVDQNGRVYGYIPGNVNIRATVGSISSYVNIKVLARSGNPTSISLKGRDWLEVGSKMDLRVVTNPLGALNSVVFSSSNENIAVVNSEGIVTGKAAGNVTITATSTVNSLQTSFEIEVRDYRIDFDDWENVYKKVIASSKNSILGVANYRYALNGDNYQLIKNSIGSGVVYKAWFTLDDGSIIRNLDDLESFDNVKTYHYYLVTNKHVVEESDAVQIYLHEIDEEIPATLIQYDLKVDIAVVYFEYEEYIRPLEFADVSNLEAGEYVLAIGNPSGFEYSSSATHGIISHPQRYLPDDTDGDGISDWDAEYIQHDAAINPGNSGGPLLNLKGEIIGINTLKFASNEIDNMGFSIPSNTVVPLLEILEKGEVPRRATLGLTSITVKDLIAYPDPNYPLPQGVTYGLYVTDLIAGKAKDAGIRIGDIILSANGKELRNTIDIRLALAAIIVGTDDELRLSVLRDGEIIEFILVY